MTVDHLPLSNAAHVCVLDNGAERVVLVKDLCSRLAVDALIRLHASEFDLISLHDRFLVHFNLEFTLNQVGCYYAVVPIIKAGQRNPDGEEALPVINPDVLRRGVCTDVLQKISIDSVTEHQFSESLPNIRTVEDLKEALVRRYGRMFPNLSSKMLLDRGCAITRIVFVD
jgi:hypothetical protein